MVSAGISASPTAVVFDDPPIAIKNVLDLTEEGFLTDEVLTEVLPKRYTFISVENYGRSAWTHTAKVTTKRSDGSEKPFFLKISYGNHGGVMLQGEYESAREVVRLMPDLIPQPRAFGQFKVESPVTYYYLSDFIEMDTTTVPDPTELARQVAELHKTSRSPTGKFGFHVTTCDGRMPHTVDWEDSWPKFFCKLLLGVSKLDTEANGPWPEMERATKQVLDFVVPRLLGDLKQDGKPIKPSLLHGDLWEPNLGVDKKTGRLIMYDVGSYYAHNEMDLGHWRNEFCSHLRSKVYLEQYLRQYPAAEPREEFDDRNRLYCLKGNLNWSAGHPNSVLRRTAYNHMCYLCEKYAPLDGIDKYDPGKDPTVTGASIVVDVGPRRPGTV
ncbi:hypothetical protein PFICI_13426 [Pestalotiopsis fici W106-1]|uniref:protein-ribulosamine 3-kinase n=1 Tax=Pestalotiopsis fici (strain W106-1 / CGMCC3.15140) TaxID=1229662 RepID=W3WP83_PESFW|nr:uncharacterized protein PFICI_13426 [Pestalotiopsis fici W106-1]ETS74942.1 hypothetical protein PFICI_13426 [Pestalotiopsis fici W106-1]